MWGVKECVHAYMKEAYIVAKFIKTTSGTLSLGPASM